MKIGYKQLIQFTAKKKKKCSAGMVIKVALKVYQMLFYFLESDLL